jgi:hypothetical protein
MSQSISQRAARSLLIAALVQGLASACDTTESVAPTDSRKMTVPDAVAYTVSASNLSANVVSWSEIDVSWATSPSASGYQIFLSTTGANGAYVLLTTTGANVKSYANTGLSGSTEYCYKVRSYKTAGKNTNYGAYAGPLCATTLPPPVVAPSEINAVPQGDRIHITWTDNSSNEDGFHVEQAPALTGPWTTSVSMGPNLTSADVNVPAEQQVCFRVIAFNAAGPSLPSTPDCTTPPASPTNLVARVSTQTSIALAWSDNSAVEDGYKVSRMENGGVWTDIATLPANTVSYRDGSVRQDVSYTYQVQALKDGGFSGRSNAVTAMISTTPPNTPSYIAVSYYQDTEGYGWNYLTIWWGASTNADGYRVEYSPDGLGGWTSYGTTDANFNYIQLQFSVFGPPPPSGCYRVIAFNAAGESSPTTVTCSEPGVVPTDLVATAVDQQSIDLTWTDNARLESGYVVVRSTAVEGEYPVVVVLPANATSYHDTGLTTGQEYSYVVASVYGINGDSWSDYSNYAAATPGSATSGASAIRISPNIVVGRAAPSKPVPGKRIPPHVPPRAVRDGRHNPRTP